MSLVTPILPVEMPQVAVFPWRLVQCLAQPASVISVAQPLALLASATQWMPAAMRVLPTWRTLQAPPRSVELTHLLDATRVTSCRPASSSPRTRTLSGRSRTRWAQAA